ncbi:MAG TPA: hypothetical protein V6D08_09570 [Candidatus Obscuribacterales bacterium]
MCRLLTLLDKLVCLLVFAPPLYIVYRFLKWYFKQAQESEAS